MLHRNLSPSEDRGVAAPRTAERPRPVLSEAQVLDLSAARSTISGSGPMTAHAAEGVLFRLWGIAPSGSAAKAEIETVLTATLHRHRFEPAELLALVAKIEAECLLQPVG